MPSIKERITALEKKSGRDSGECETDVIDCGSRSTSSSRPLSAPATSSISNKIKALNISVKNSNSFVGGKKCVSHFSFHLTSMKSFLPYVPFPDK